MLYTYIIVKKIQIIPLRLPHLLIVHNFNSHFFCIAFKSVEKSSVQNTSCRTQHCCVSFPATRLLSLWNPSADWTTHRWLINIFCLLGCGVQSNPQNEDSPGPLEYFARKQWWCCACAHNKYKYIAVVASNVRCRQQICRCTLKLIPHSDSMFHGGISSV